MEEPEPVTTPRKPLYQQPRAIMLGVIGLLVAVFIFSWVYTAAAAHGYQKAYASYQSSLKQVATKATKVNYEAILEHNPSTQKSGDEYNDAEQYKAASAECTTISTLAAQASRTQPHVASNVFTAIGSPLSSSYRSAHRQQANSPLAVSTQTLQQHLQRDVQNCTAFNKDYAIQAKYSHQITETSNFLVPCDTGGGDCVPAGQEAAFKKLYLANVSYAKDEAALYGTNHNCPYPELAAGCQALGTYWQDEYKATKAYDDALAPGADYATVGQDSYAAAKADLQKLCTTVQKIQPVYSQVAAAGHSCDPGDSDPLTATTTLSEMIKLLTTTNETVVHTTAQTILKN